MKWFLKIIFIIPTLLSLGCGEDPILEQARSANKSPSQQTASPEKEVKSSTKQTEIPKIAPPNDGNTANKRLELPKVEPPQRVQEGEPPPKPESQKFVLFEGKISVDNWSGKPIRIDIFDGDQRNIGGKRPSVVLSEKLDTIGDFSIKVPQEEGNVWIGAYIDEDQDGRPGPKDPSGWYAGNPVSSTQNQSGISFSLGLPDEPASE